MELYFPRYIKREGGLPAVNTAILPSQLRSLINRPNRTWPFINRRFNYMRVRMVLNPGDNWAIKKAPQAGLVLKKFVTWSLSFKQENGKITTERILAVRPGRIESRDYPGFIKTLKGIYEKEARKVILKRK